MKSNDGCPSPNRVKTQMDVSPRCLPFHCLSGGKFEFGDSDLPLDLPAWTDLELLRHGQAFASSYLYGVFYAHLLSLVILLGQTENRRLMYSTGKSETPYKARRRYLATLLQIKLWYEADLGSPQVMTSLNNIRTTHRRIGIRFEINRPDFSGPNVTGGDGDEGALWTCFRDDCIESNVIKKPELPESKKPSHVGQNTPYYFSQYDMAITQWSFMALPILFPAQLGLRGTTDRDLEGFIHLWAVIGSVLGLQDDYNIGLGGSLGQVRELCDSIYKGHLLPQLLIIDYETEVMWLALLNGVRGIVPFLRAERLLLNLLEDIVGIQCPRLRKRIGWPGLAFRFLGRLIFRPLLRFPWFRQFCTWRLRTFITRAALETHGFSDSSASSVAGKAYF